MLEDRVYRKALEDHVSIAKLKKRLARTAIKNLVVSFEEVLKEEGKLIHTTE